MTTKPSFLGKDKPLLTVMLEMGDPEAVIAQIRQANADGADAYGVELNRTPTERLNEGDLAAIFRHMDGRPAYVTCYQKGTTEGLSPEAREDALVMAVRAGASLVDVMGGWYDSSAPEFSQNPAVIQKQVALVDRLHAAGAEILMSSHFYEFLPEERVLDIAKQQRERGADVVKIISWTATRGQLAENLSATLRLKDAGYTFLFASNGPLCKLHRSLAPFLGESIVLCAQSYGPGTSLVQPLLKAQKAAMENIPWRPSEQGGDDAATYRY